MVGGCASRDTCLDVILGGGGGGGDVIWRPACYGLGRARIRTSTQNVLSVCMKAFMTLEHF